MHKSGQRLTVGEQSEIGRRLLAGESFSEVAAALGCCTKSIQRLVKRGGGIAPRVVNRSALRLSLSEREEISRRIVAGDSLRQIAALLHRSPSTISREVSASGTRYHYRAHRAERAMVQRSRRPKPMKLATQPNLRALVEQGLCERWSPQQICARLVRDYPDDPKMRVSHETIYRSLFVQTRGALRKELTAHLRTQRTHRRPRKSASSIGRGRIPDMVLISQRPAEASDRAVPGHWEGDLIVGKGGRSAIVTLVERRSRYVLLAPLPEGRSAEKVRIAIGRQIQTLPAELRRSLTWDQGREMAEHVRFSVDNNIAVYFCDPHSPWQRASNENTNGLLRQYFPKATDLSVHSPEHLAVVAAQLNNRPRQTLGWMKPSEVFSLAVASTA